VAGKQSKITNLDVRSDAEKLAEEETRKFSEALMLEAKIIAYKNDLDTVSKSHITEAVNNLRNKKDRNKWVNLKFVFSGGLIGAFVQGFPAELSNNHPILVILFVTFGFIGVILCFWP
jgi:hypothetical protein